MREKKREIFKTEVFQIRLTKSQKKQIKQLAKSCGMAMSEYILFKAIPKVEHGDEAKVILATSMLMYPYIGRLGRKDNQ